MAHGSGSCPQTGGLLKQAAIPAQLLSLKKWHILQGPDLPSELYCTDKDRYPSFLKKVNKMGRFEFFVVPLYPPIDKYGRS